jgi:PAS domain-containing protein
MLENGLEGVGFNSWFDAAVDALLVVDDTGHVMAANLAAQRLLG